MKLLSKKPSQSLILLAGLLLLLFGLGALFSASTYESFSTTLGFQHQVEGDTLPFLASLFLSLTISFLCMLSIKFLLSNYPLLSTKRKYTILFGSGIISFLILFRSTKSLIIESLVYPSNYFYFWRQIVNVGFAFLLGGITYVIPIRIFQSHKFIGIVIITIFLLQLGVFLPAPIGVSLNGARGWINLGFRTIQPAEFFKLGFVIFFSSRLTRKSKQNNQLPFFISLGIVTTIFFAPFLFIPDFGSIIVMAPTLLIMLRYSGTKLKYVSALFFGGLFIGGISLALLTAITSKYDYTIDRLMCFLPQDSKDYNEGPCRQNEQALIAIGGGKFRGQGYGKGLQKFRKLPEAQSDFIFSAMSEEIGFVGNMILLALYALLFYSVMSNIATKNKKYDHLKLLGVGILSLILIQTFVNIGVNLKILPNTGLTLPFISHGGTAIMVNTIEIVILYKIATLINKQTEKSSK